MHDVLPGFVVNPSYGLLDPRADGWVREQSWPGLFYLYTRDGEASAELSPELGAIEAALLQGYSAEDTAVANMKRALFMSAVICQGMKEGVDGDFGFQHFRKQVADEIARTFGAIVIEIFCSKTLCQAELKAGDAINLMKRAMGVVVRMKFPGRGRGNRSSVPKALLAIWHARALCQYHRRLPTKREVRSALEAIEVDYARSKDQDGRWADLFIRAGLGGLPD